MSTVYYARSLIASWVISRRGRRSVIVHSGFRGLRYADGRFDEVLEPGRYELPKRPLHS